MAIAGLSALYSAPAFHMKGVPLLNSALHLIGGLLHFLLGYSLLRPVDGRSLEIGCFFALIFAALLASVGGIAEGLQSTG